ncbi:MAG: preprotein translocase subunit YajC [Clostridiales bacterium]|nr:preprotein translocase subunit YajC [Clostridiales bacterium]
MNLLYTLGAMDSQSIIMIAVLGVLMVLMLVMSIVPQRKRQKEAQKMMDSLTAGTKVKTIGGFIGEIKSIDGGTIVIDLSPKCDGSNLCVLDKSAIYTIMQVGANGQVEEVKQEAPKALDDVAPAKEEAKTEEAKEEKAKDEKIF